MLAAAAAGLAVAAALVTSAAAPFRPTTTLASAMRPACGGGHFPSRHGAVGQKRPNVAADRQGRRAVLTAAPLSILGAWSNTMGVKADELRPQKQRNLPIGKIRDVVEKDFIDRKCLVSGDLSPEIYSDDCIFTDPQMTCKGFKKFASGTKALFYEPKSELELLEPVSIVGDNQIVAKFREVACFNIPFRPRTFFTGNLTLTLGEDNLIERYVEQWDLSIPEILRTAKI